MALQLRDSNLYASGGFIVQLEGDEQLLLRNPLEPRQELTDQYQLFREGDQLNRLAFAFYKDQVNADTANEYWFLIADRNNVFDPLENTFVQGDGDLVPINGNNVVIPNVLSQQVEL